MFQVKNGSPAWWFERTAGGHQRARKGVKLLSKRRSIELAVSEVAELQRLLESLGKRAELGARQRRKLAGCLSELERRTGAKTSGKVKLRAQLALSILRVLADAARCTREPWRHVLVPTERDYRPDHS